MSYLAKPKGNDDVGPDAAQAEEMRLWRCLLIAIKAKLEVVESGIATFEQEFLAHIVLPDQTTVGEWVAPQLDRAYEANTMPLQLPALGAGDHDG